MVSNPVKLHQQLRKYNNDSLEQLKILIQPIYIGESLVAVKLIRGPLPNTEFYQFPVFVSQFSQRIEPPENPRWFKVHNMYYTRDNWSGSQFTFVAHPDLLSEVTEFDPT